MLQNVLGSLCIKYNHVGRSPKLLRRAGTRFSAIGIIAIIIFFFSLIGQTGRSRPKPESITTSLQEDLLKAGSSDKAAEAFKKYFVKYDKTALKTAMQDKDTSIALQAAWEVYKTPGKRKDEIASRSDDVYDPEGQKKFGLFASYGG